MIQFTKFQILYVLRHKKLYFIKAQFPDLGHL